MRSKTGKFKRLWAYLQPYWRLELVCFLAMVTLSVLQLALPASVQYLIDRLVPRLIEHSESQQRWLQGIGFGGILVAVYVVVLFLAWARDYLAAKIGGNILADIRAQLLLHLERLSVRFHQEHKVGELMSRLISDVSRIQELFTTTLLSFLTNLLFLAAILSYLFIINWKLTLLALIPIPLMIIVTLRFGKRINRIARVLQETTASLSAKVQELLVGVKTVKAFGREELEQQRVQVVLDDLKGVYIRFSVTQSLTRNVIQLIAVAGPIVVLTIGAFMVADGALTLGGLLAFFILLNWLNMPVQVLAQTPVEFQSTLASVDRVFEYLDVPLGITEDRTPISLSCVRGDVTFETVTFSYDDEGFRLEDFRLAIAAGTKLAIVGPSGSGKTTIINLAMRFYDPAKGRITLDGIDLRKLSTRTLREQIALVDQDPLLFNMTIRDNIAFGRPTASTEDIESAARVANIHEFITQLPHGYDTVVGERGVTLSGGEKQRLCLARAVLMNPAVLILDEATSALDSISERLIQDALDVILKDKTAIIIAHRLSTVQKADRIITLVNGRIVDEGTHPELLKRSPVYRELAQQQLAD